MDREIDFRSDLYSLGVSLYELATGELPFSAEPLELIHMHLAVTPNPPHSVNGEVPEQLGRIIMRLMEKDPDKRYQNAGGLHADLLTCRTMLEEEGRIDWFELGERDVPTTLVLPRALYGREEELRVLEQAFQAVIRGATELVVISGPPGVGKSTLVNSLKQSRVNDRIQFLRGGFERYQVNVPYVGVAQAVNGWLEHLLAGSEEELQHWREVVTDALEDDLDAVCRVVPKLALMVAPGESEGGEEKSERISRASSGLLRLFRCIGEEMPMILFLDDLQWADTASLGWIQALLDEKPAISCLLILSHRCSDGVSDMPFEAFRNDLLREGSRCRHLALEPWSLEHVNTFLAETLELLPRETHLLAESVMRKTGGNAQFIRQYLRHIYAEGLVRYEVGRGWVWDLEAIEGAGIPDDIAGIMTEKLARLPERARRVIEQAACIGRRFDVSLLGSLSGLSEEDVDMELYTLTFEGLIAPQEQDYHFTHHRIYEAVIEQIPDEVRARHHVQIGNMKLDGAAGVETLQRDIFEIVDHLNHGVSDAIDPAMRIRLAQLNLKAGRKATESAAFANAAVYFRIGLGLMKESDWRDHYDLIFDLSLELAHNRFMDSDYAKAGERFRQMLDHDLTLRDRARVVARMVGLFNLQGQPLRGIRIGIDGLAELGLRIPSLPSRSRVFRRYLMTELALYVKTPKQLASLPMNEDARALARLRILIEVLQPAYSSSARMTSFLLLIMIQQTLRHGVRRCEIGIYQYLETAVESSA